MADSTWADLKLTNGETLFGELTAATVAGIPFICVTDHATEAKRILSAAAIFEVVKLYSEVEAGAELESRRAAREHAAARVKAALSDAIEPLG